jgi:mono/diheme cytochrome c family protein
VNGEPNAARRGGVRVRIPRAWCVAIAVTALLAGCERIDRNMWYNPAFSPQEEPVRLPPSASVPTKGLEHVPAPGDAGTAALKNPEKVTDATLLAGKSLFHTYCTPCHGASGMGDGPVAAKLVPRPINISGTGFGKFAPEGLLFSILTHGAGGMPSFYEDLTPLERWRVVAYVKTLK